MPQLEFDPEREIASLRARINQLEADIYNHINNPSLGSATDNGHRDTIVTTNNLITNLLTLTSEDPDNSTSTSLIKATWTPDASGPMVAALDVYQGTTYRHQLFHIDLTLALNTSTDYNDLFTGMYTGYTFMGGLIMAGGFRMDTGASLGSIFAASADGTAQYFGIIAGTGGVYFNASGGITVKAHTSYETHIIGILIALWDKD